MKKIPGIALLVSVSSLLTMACVCYSFETPPPAKYIQHTIALLVVSIAVAGCYLVSNYCPSTNKSTKLQIYLLGLLIMIFGPLVAYDIVSILSGFNWLFAAGIIFVMLVQLQLLNWGDKTGSVVKICSVLLLISDLFLAIYYIIKWSDTISMTFVNLAITVSLLAFGTGIAFLPGRRRKKTADERLTPES